MSSINWQNGNSKVSVGLSLENNEQGLVDYTLAFAGRLRMGVRFVHVSKPGLGTRIVEELIPSQAAATVFHAVENERVIMAERRLHELVCKQQEKGAIDGAIDGNIAEAVHVGQISRLMISDAISHAGAVIVMGVPQPIGRFVPTMLSNYLETVANSPLPVLAVPRGSSFPEKNKRIKILFADDLGHECTYSLQEALKLAAALTNCHFLHFHVNETTLNTIESSISSVLGASHTTPNESLSSAQIFSMIEKNIYEVMDNRSAAQRKIAELADVSYEAEICEGDVTENLMVKIDTYAPDLIVFGKHRSLHLKSMHLGKAPLSVLLTANKPLMVIP